MALLAQQQDCFASQAHLLAAALAAAVAAAAAAEPAAVQTAADANRLADQALQLGWVHMAQAIGALHTLSLPLVPVLESVAAAVFVYAWDAVTEFEHELVLAAAAECVPVLAPVAAAVSVLGQQKLVS